MARQQRGDGMSAATFEITSSPIAALLPGNATLLVGVERETDGALRLYVGARYRGTYAVIAPGEDTDRVEAAWNGSMGHLWMTPIPDALFCDKAEQGRAA